MTPAYPPPITTTSVFSVIVSPSFLGIRPRDWESRPPARISRAGEGSGGSSSPFTAPPVRAYGKHAREGGRAQQPGGRVEQPGHAEELLGKDRVVFGCGLQAPM